MALTTILSENRNYWTGRSAGYSEINREELSTEQKKKWKRFLESEIAGHFPGRNLSGLHALDIGTGPGFLPSFSVNWESMSLRST